ncbi:MAG: N-acetylmuramoyl-L-alanine amidase, partial [Bacteroidota bacterium]
TSLTSFAQNGNEDDRFVVVLDAGHGGHDPGNLGNGYKEKNIALKVTLEVGKALEKNPDIKVIYTRKTDVFLELYERSAIANKADADLFVSIHCNAHNTRAFGTETFVLGVANTERNKAIAKKENEVIFLEKDYEKNYGGFDPNSPESTIAIDIEQEVYVEQSIRLARNIEDNFKHKLKRKSRGLKQASLWVMHNTYMPSVLIELGFLTNYNEGKFLNSKKGQSEMADAIKNAILKYKNEIDMNVGDSFLIDEQEEIVDALESKTEERIIDGVVFKVQIASSSRKLEPKPYNFNGLDEVSRFRLDGKYKYFYGYTSDYNKVLRLKAEAKAKGYLTCFIVAYKGEDRIPVDEALKTASN